MLPLSAGSATLVPGAAFFLISQAAIRFALLLSSRKDKVPALAHFLSILWKIRIPRALCAFLVGGALAASGAVIQSILQNPLASSYTLGVSSGACLGTALVIISGAGGAAIGYVLLPAAGFGCGLLTVLLVILIASRLDAGFQNHTIILFGKNSTTQNPCALC